MLRIKVLIVGRSKESWIDAGVEEYARRMSNTLQVVTEWLKDDAQLVQILAKESRVICLDPSGNSLTSPKLADYLSQELTIGGSRLTIVIGGANGLPDLIRKNYPLISFSQLTFTHQMCRIILAEQLYRCVEIWRGSPYHK